MPGAGSQQDSHSAPVPSETHTTQGHACGHVSGTAITRFWHNVCEARVPQRQVLCVTPAPKEHGSSQRKTAGAQCCALQCPTPAQESRGCCPGRGALSGRAGLGGWGDRDTIAGLPVPPSGGQETLRDHPFPRAGCCRAGPGGCTKHRLGRDRGVHRGCSCQSHQNSPVQPLGPHHARRERRETWAEIHRFHHELPCPERVRATLPREARKPPKIITASEANTDARCFCCLAICKLPSGHVNSDSQAQTRTRCRHTSRRKHRRSKQLV